MELKDSRVYSSYYATVNDSQINQNDFLVQWEIWDFVYIYKTYIDILVKV